MTILLTFYICLGWGKGERCLGAVGRHSNEMAHASANAKLPPSPPPSQLHKFTSVELLHKVHEATEGQRETT